MAQRPRPPPLQRRVRRFFQTDARGADRGAAPAVGIFIAGGFVALEVPALRALFPAGTAEREGARRRVRVTANDAPIALWEIYAVLVAVDMYGDYMSGGRWHLLTDTR